MGVFCDRLESGSTAAHDYQPDKNKKLLIVKKAPIPTRLVVCSTYFVIQIGLHLVANIRKKS